MKFISILFLLFVTLPTFADEFVYVSVEKADLKNGTGIFSEKIAELKYGTKLLVLENTIEDEWIKVSESENKEISGWILSKNVTKKRIVKLFDKVGSSDTEQALAGKGSKIEKSKVNKNKFNTIKK